MSKRRLFNTFLPLLIATVAAVTGYMVASHYLLPDSSSARSTKPSANSPVASPPAGDDLSLQLVGTGSPESAADTASTGSIPNLLRDSPQGFGDLDNALELVEADPAAATSIHRLKWIGDGVSHEEREAAQFLVYFALTNSEVFQILMEKSWLDTGKPADLVRILGYLDTILMLDPDSARNLVSMPFLDSLEPADLPAVESLSRMALQDFGAFRRVMDHPRIRDGISNEEAPLVSILSGVNQANPALVAKALESQITVEERRIILPMAGPVTLAILRTQDGATRSMELLEHAVRTAEGLLGAAFPVQFVALYFEDAAIGHHAGANFGTHSTILTKYDAPQGMPESGNAGSIIAHEVAHHYWNAGETWLDEGAAQLMAAVSEYARTGQPPEPRNYPCPASGGLAAIEAQNFNRSPAGYACNYALGERLFLDLYYSLDDAAFREGFRRLYHRLQDSKGLDEQPKGFELLMDAFGETANSANIGPPNVLDRALNRWYRGHPEVGLHGPDNRPVVAELPEVGGWINRAYVSPAEGEAPVGTMAASDVGTWAWLALEYSHDYAGPPIDLTFEVVEYFEDGFPYRRTPLIVEADRRHAGGVRWISVGPGPGRDWAIGHHWIYVHHEGRKVAQVEFEVIP